METSLFFKAALTADALSCSSHWAYERESIFPLSPVDSANTSSLSDNDREISSAAGMRLTHLGEQMIWLRQSLDESGRYDPEQWRAQWLTGMSGYRGHIDAASSFTLEHTGLWPARSDDVGGAARLAPLLDLGLGMEETVRAARCQTALTHGNPGVADAAEFFVRATFAIEEGEDISQSLFLAAASGNYQQLEAGDLLARALSTDPDDLEGTARELGTLGGVREAFPLMLYLAERPKSDFPTIIEENAQVGGETSARSMLLALLFAARDGTSVLDEQLLDGILSDVASGHGSDGELARTA